MKTVYITGMGIVSAIGENLADNLNNLRMGKTGISKAMYLDSNYSSTHLFGEVKIDTRTLQKESGFDQVKSLTRTEFLAIKAFREAVDQAGLSKEEISSADTAFISATTVGGMCMTNELHADANLLSGGSDYLSSYCFGAHTLAMAKLFHLKGITTTFNTACSSSANAILFGARLIRSGRVKRAIVGGTDSLSKFTINGFNSLQILSPTACKPFDEHRCGLTLGEGAAYLVLESEDTLGTRSKYAELKGYGNANDAHHPSAISEQATGVTESISKALLSAALDASQIDYINAHGTATPNNDKAELTGIEKTLGHLPPFTSTKSYTGHTLAASGAIEAIYSILSLSHAEMYASLNCETPIANFNTMPVIQRTPFPNMRYVLSNSFGFAGNCSSLIFGKV
jgi:3-oxoacyl-(acyl-carrier-protein) synthase